MENEPEYLRNIGQKIRQFRIARNLTQLQLAIDSQTPLSQIGAIERGAANPTAKTLKKLCDCLEVDVVRIFEQ